MERKKRIVEKIAPAEKDKFLHDLLPYLPSGKFVNAATCSMERMPNVAPKLIGKVESNIIYLIDYVVGRTYSNLRKNPRISVSFFDEKILTGYQLNGSVALLEHGEEFDKLAEEFQRIKTEFTVERILMNVRSGERAQPMEFQLPERFVILKVKVIEIVEISSSGALKAKVAL